MASDLRDTRCFSNFISLPSRFSNKILCSFLILLTRFTCTAHLTFIGFILIIFGDEYV